MVPSGERHCHPVFVVSGAQKHLSGGEQASARVQVSAPATDSWADLDAISPCRAVGAGLGHFRTPGHLDPLKHMALGPRSETCPQHYDLMGCLTTEVFGRDEQS